VSPLKYHLGPGVTMYHLGVTYGVTYANLTETRQYWYNIDVFRHYCINIDIGIETRQYWKILLKHVSFMFLVS